LIRRFEREVQTTATLQSQHTVQVYDFGVTEDGALYYVMEYLEGLNLQTMIESYGPIPPERAVHFLLQMLESLDEAHRAGLVHRDIKPANIIAGKYGVHYDFIKLLDFGLARCVENTHSTGTVFPMVAGTPAFMAPESALNTQNADVRSDLYAVGAVGYWMLTGRLLFEEGLSDFETLMEHINNVPVPPSQKSETPIPPELDRIIMACLEKNPNDRPQTAAELMARLKAIPLASTWAPERAEHWWQAHRPATQGSLAPVQPAINVFEEGTKLASVG
jgi:serine/threonine-protein kinase